MLEQHPDLLSEDALGIHQIRRITLLPLWIKIFMWIFLIFGAIIPIILILGILGNSAHLELYGLKTNTPISIIGLTIIILFLIKGITAFGLLQEKDWAIKIGIADAIIGIIICTLLMLNSLIYSDYIFTARLELIALIPYLIKLIKIKSRWEDSNLTKYAL